MLFSSAVYFESIFVILFEKVLPGDISAVFPFVTAARRGLEPKIDICLGVWLEEIS